MDGPPPAGHKRAEEFAVRKLVPGDHARRRYIPPRDHPQSIIEEYAIDRNMLRRRLSTETRILLEPYPY